MHLTLFKANDSDNAGVPLPASEVPSHEQFEQLSEEAIVEGIMVARAERIYPSKSSGWISKEWGCGPDTAAALVDQAEPSGHLFADHDKAIIR